LKGLRPFKLPSFIAATQASVKPEPVVKVIIGAIAANY